MAGSLVTSPFSHGVLATWGMYNISCLQERLVVFIMKRYPVLTSCWDFVFALYSLYLLSSLSLTSVANPN